MAGHRVSGWHFEQRDPSICRICRAVVIFFLFASFSDGGHMQNDVYDCSKRASVGRCYTARKCIQEVQCSAHLRTSNMTGNNRWRPARALVQCKRTHVCAPVFNRTHARVHTQRECAQAIPGKNLAEVRRRTSTCKLRDVCRAGTKGAGRGQHILLERISSFSMGGCVRAFV